LNLLVTFNVNFPEQEECSNSLDQRAHAQPAQEPARDTALSACIIYQDRRLSGSCLTCTGPEKGSGGSLPEENNSIWLGILAGGKKKNLHSKIILVKYWKYLLNRGTLNDHCTNPGEAYPWEQFGWGNWKSIKRQCLSLCLMR